MRRPLSCFVVVLTLCSFATASAQTSSSATTTDNGSAAGTLPRIIVSASPALLIQINGDPDYQPVNGTALERIVNAKALILRDEARAAGRLQQNI